MLLVRSFGVVYVAIQHTFELTVVSSVDFMLVKSYGVAYVSFERIVVSTVDFVIIIKVQQLTL